MANFVINFAKVYVIFSVIVMAVVLGTIDTKPAIDYEDTLIECRHKTYHMEVVTATVYFAIEAQTDSTPHITADGTHFDVNKAGEYRYCALSRDLLSRWGGAFDYGDTIWVENAGKFTGTWIVRDSMHERWKKRIDFLVDIGTYPYTIENVYLWEG